LIAFGVGWLAGSLLPASVSEQQAANKVKDVAAPVLGDAAKDVAEHLKAPAQQAVESMKDTAVEAAATIKDEGASAAHEVKEQAQDAADTGATPAQLSYRDPGQVAGNSDPGSAQVHARAPQPTADAKSGHGPDDRRRIERASVG
jgi:hypothetical protein